MDLVPGPQLLLGEDAVPAEQLDMPGLDIGLKGVCGAGEVAEAPLPGLGHPGVLVAVAVEDDPLVLGKGPLDHVMQGGVEVRRLLQLIGELAELLGHDGVQSHVGTGDGLAGAQHPELELVAREGQRGGAVAVGGILRDGGQGVHADGDALHPLVHVPGAVDDGVHNSGQLIPQEHGDNSGRSLLSAQPVIVARVGHGAAQQVLILVHALDEGRQEQKEPGVLAGGGAGLEEVVARVGGEGPVVVLAGTVDPGKGLFVEEADHVVPPGHLLHDLHSQLVVVAGGVGVAVNGGQLMLGGSHLVVLGLGQDAQLPQLLVQLLHVGRHPGLDGAEVVVLQLLPLGGLGPEEGASGEDQVLPPVEHVLVNEEVFLLGPHLADHLLHVRIPEELEYPDRLTAQLVHGAQEGGSSCPGPDRCRSRKRWGCRGSRP